MNPEILILSGALKNRTIAQTSTTVLSEDHFFDEDRKNIFKAMRARIRSGEEISLASLAGDSVNFLFNVTKLYEINSHVTLSEAYMEEVIHELLSRKLLVEFQDEFPKRMENIDGKGFMKTLKYFYDNYYISKERVGSIRSMAEILEDYEDGKSFIEVLRERRSLFHEGLPQKGIFTRTDALDQVMGIVPYGSYTIIGARTSVGKTTVALSIASRIADHNSPVIFVSLEMITQQIANKVVSQASQISNQKIDEGNITEFDIHNIQENLKSIANPYLYVYESNALKVESLDAFIKSAIEETGAKVFFFDYITLIKSTKLFKSKHLEVDAVSKELQSLAKKYKICIFALAQLSRDIERRTNKKPTLADLRESGSLEEDADFVLLLSRPHLDNPEIHPNHVEFFVAKNRLHGNLGVVNLFLKQGVLIKL